MYATPTGHGVVALKGQRGVAPEVKRGVTTDKVTEENPTEENPFENPFARYPFFFFITLRPRVE